MTSDCFRMGLGQEVGPEEGLGLGKGLKVMGLMMEGGYQND